MGNFTPFYLWLEVDTLLREGSPQNGLPFLILHQFLCQKAFVPEHRPLLVDNEDVAILILTENLMLNAGFQQVQGIDVAHHIPTPTFQDIRASALLSVMASMTPFTGQSRQAASKSLKKMEPSGLTTACSHFSAQKSQQSFRVNC